MKIVFIGGHITPAVAVMNELRNLDQNAKVYLIGRKHSREGDTSLSTEFLLAKEMGLPFFYITTGRLQRELTRYTFLSLLKIPIGFFQSFWYLYKIRPDIILSFGGYLAVPVVVSGWLMGIPCVTHEQTIKPGLANMIVSRFCKIVAVSFAVSQKYYPGIKVKIVGNPIRKEIFTISKSISFKDKSLPCILIMGGNQGSHAINTIIFSILGELVKFANIIHQTGNSKVYDDYHKGLKLKQSLINTSKGEYHPFEYIDSNLIGGMYDVCDLVICRSGANTVIELLVLKKKAIFIPLNSEQEANAKYFLDFGPGIILNKRVLSKSTLIEAIKRLIVIKISKNNFPNMVLESKIHTKASLTMAKLILQTFNEK